MSSLCCFEHPELDDEPHTLNDTCRVCGREFGFPIFDAPEYIGDYKVVRALDRGFYSAAFVVEVGLLRQWKVVKVAPKRVYEKFCKNFRKECEVHAAVAKGSQHVVAIDDLKEDVIVRFGDVELECDVAILHYVNGMSLKTFLNESDQMSAATLAQLAIDLFAILRELQLRSVHHNDLHAGNLMVEILPETARRADAEDGAIRLVAIDLNSLTDESKSDAGKQRLGDIHWAVSHLKSFVDKLLCQPDATSDRDYRLASVLEERAFLLSPKVEKQRTPTYDQCIEDIKLAVRQVSSPWTETPRLRRFNDAYNAQTLSPWFVPYLIVDPEDRWLPAVSTPGPQVIIGMRGCGKTMLIRALQLHARATLPDSNADATTVIEQLRSDGYVGLYVSATRLLDTVGETNEELLEPYARLFVSYALEAIRAVRHLREIDPTQVVPGYFKEIAKAVAGYVKGADEIADALSEMQLEKMLLSVQVSLSRGEETFAFTGNPANAFPDLAEAICLCSPLWSHCCVLYLLDDVSTRFLEIPKIDLLMSSLLFSHPRCSFKLTTEVQTLEVILRSPGQIEKARAGRDYEVFDLGAEVNQIIRQRKRGKDFIERILAHRATYFLDHPDGIRPAQVLGDTPLESIAMNIASTTKTSNDRKQVYFSLSALAGVCVGDLGDAISIYELMLRKAKGKAGKQSFPIDARIQTDCYLEYCSRRMYDLNRRQTKLRDHALAFAEASNELLMQSYTDHDQSSKTAVRLRQYLKVYMRLTKGDTDAQFDEFRELVDAGVFVLDGGTHRTKTKDANPIKQFKLTFRKIFGLSSFIGLGERDRFELSGDAVVEWLRNPARGKEILLRNLGKENTDADGDFEDDSDLIEDDVKSVDKAEANELSQLGLFDFSTSKPEVSTKVDDSPEEKFALEKSPRCVRIQLRDLRSCDINTLVLGLGFEERTVASVDRILSAITPKTAVLVEYTEEGKSQDIRRLLERHQVQTTVVPYDEISRETFISDCGNTLVDVTGLAKPALFHSVRNALATNNNAFICHTSAKSYYPLDEDIQAILQASEEKDYWVLLERMSRVLTGDKGQYSTVSLLVSDADESRRRMLCAFASPRHERLLTLLDRRQYDRVQLVAQNRETPRGELARLSADFASKNYPATSVEELETNNLSGVMQFLTQTYHRWYVDNGFNFELGLTGSKLQAVGKRSAGLAAFQLSTAGAAGF
ncbi:hypothetical protein, partial [Novipirellula rosea]|uniref:ORC-CDC6 family AAA ATPase n=1 Tax=Novipirellula rosea TaxID=1031540 RepID=UPI0031EC4968